jgi:hypothetical protein
MNVAQLAVLIGRPGRHPDIVRVGNAIVVYARDTSPKMKAAAERAIERLRE